MSTYIVLKGKSIKDDSTTLNVQLHKTMRLRGDWEVSVISAVLNASNEVLLWLLCDVVDYSVVNNLSVQLLDIIQTGSEKNTKPMYVKVIKKTFSSINVDIQKEVNKDELIEFDGEAIIDLHFRKA